jgi:CheY-like chemotaxis protein/glycine cleavage system H lipoate-binding protein
MSDDKLNILVVDDEQIVLDSVAKHLRREPVEIHTALSADQGLKLLEDIDIDVVLTDLMMPEIDGLEFMKLVKDRDPDIPVIMITGYATVNTALQATQLGAFDYVAKPFSKKELLGVVRRALDVARAARDNSTSNSDGSPSDTLQTRSFKTIGKQSWLMLGDDGTVQLGVEHSFLHEIGKIQTLYLPDEGDEVRQGSVYLKIFSTDLTAYTILSPLTGTVVEVNKRVIEDPNTALEDPYGDGWLIRLKPSRLKEELKLLGLG